MDGQHEVDVVRPTMWSAHLGIQRCFLQSPQEEAGVLRSLSLRAARSQGSTGRELSPSVCSFLPRSRSPAAAPELAGGVRVPRLGGCGAAFAPGPRCLETREPGKRGERVA